MYFFSLNTIQTLGRPALDTLIKLGAMFIFFSKSISSCFNRHIFKRLVIQVYIIGAKSFFLISLIGLFTGMVLGLQGYYTLVKFGSKGLLGAAVALTLLRELGPVLTAIMITGRAGSAMAAEIGVMRISDQIDALKVMDISPYSYLVSPRLLACIISFPLLTAIFDVIGIIGGYLTGVTLLGINSGVYFYRMESSVVMADITGGLIKSLVFGILVATACCFKGYFAHLRRDGVGPEAVSNATTSAVVLSSVLILISDYVLTSVLL